MCEHISYSGFPEQIQLNADGRPNSSDEAAARDRALHNAGLLTERPEEIAIPDRFVPGRQHLQHTLVYDIAPGHQDLWQPISQNDRNPMLCFARVHIRSVDHYDEPGDTFNLRIAEVDYTYELTDVAAWAKRPDVQDALPALKEKVTAPEGKEQAELTPTNHGWRPDPGTHIADSRPETASF